MHVFTPVVEYSPGLKFGKTLSQNHQKDGKIWKKSPTLRQDAMYHVFGALNKKCDVVLSHPNNSIFFIMNYNP